MARIRPVNYFIVHCVAPTAQVSVCVEGGFLVWLSSYSGREFLALIVFFLLIVSLCLSLCLSDMIMALISFEA